MLANPVRVLEQLSVYTPLGIRFWDPVQDSQIRDGLRVTAWRASTQRPVVSAYRTRSDIYAFHGLPGLRAVEYTTESGMPVLSPPLSFVVQVEDRRERFLPAAFGIQLPLPYRGVFPRGAIQCSPQLSSPPQTPPPGFLLYSAATRPLPSWLAAVRGELREFASDRPAAHARIRVRIGGQHGGFGLSDAAGRFTVLLAYPALSDGVNASPPVLGQGSLFGQSWPVELTVSYQPEAQQPLAGTTLPDYLSVLCQAEAGVWQQPDNIAPGTAWFGTLLYGEELIVTTTGLPYLVVSPAGSSP